MQTLDKGSDVAKQKLCNKEERRGEKIREDKKREDITLETSSRPSVKDVEVRKGTFIDHCLSTQRQSPEITDQDILDFVSYWTEISPQGKKMRFEKEKVFDHKRRLATWIKNKRKFENSGQSSTGQTSTALDFIKDFD